MIHGRTLSLRVQILLFFNLLIYSYFVVAIGSVSTATYTLSLDCLIPHIKIPISSTSSCDNGEKDEGRQNDVTDAANNDCSTLDGNKKEDRVRKMFPRELAEEMTSQMVGIVLKIYYETHSKVKNELNFQFTNAQRSVEQRCYHSSLNLFCSVNHSNANVDGISIQLHTTTSFAYTKNGFAASRMDMIVTTSSVDDDDDDDITSASSKNKNEDVKHILILLSRDVLVQSIPRILSSMRLNSSSSLSWYIQKRSNHDDVSTSSTTTTNFQTHTFKYSNLDDLLKDSSMQGRMRIDNPSNYIHKNENDNDEDVNIVDASRIQVWAYPSNTNTNDGYEATPYTKLLFIDSQLVLTNTIAANVYLESMFQPALISHPKFRKQTEHNFSLAILSDHLIPKAYMPQILVRSDTNKNSHLHLEIVGRILPDSLLSRVVETHFQNFILQPKNANNDDDSFLHLYNKFLLDQTITYPTNSNYNYKIEEWINHQLQKQELQSSSIMDGDVTERKSIRNQDNIDRFDILFINLPPHKGTNSQYFDSWIAQEYATKWIFLIQNEDSLIVVNHENNQKRHHVTKDDYQQHSQNLIQMIYDATVRQKEKYNYHDNISTHAALNTTTRPEIIIYQESLAFPFSENFLFIFPGGKESPSYQNFVRTDPNAIDKDLCFTFPKENDSNTNYDPEGGTNDNTSDAHVYCEHGNKFYNGKVHVERILSLAT